jgi:FtsZ-binding cell division protein ZapB
MGFLSNLFGKQKHTLKDLTVDDLKREQLSLQNEQRKIDSETGRLEKDETQLKSEYAQATAASQKRSI